MEEDKYYIEFLDGNHPEETLKHTLLKRYVKKRFSKRKDADTLVVIFPPWHAKLIAVQILRDRVLHSNMSCLEYEFSSRILSADYKSTAHYFEQIREKAHNDVTEILKKHDFKEVHVIGFSMGTVLATMVANSVPKVSKVVLHAPGNCMAECLWKGIRTQKIRRAFEKQGLSLIKLKKEWKSLAPENNLTQLRNTKMHIVISQKDHVVPHECGLKLIRRPKQQGLKVNV